MQGGCLCRAVRFETDAVPLATAVCHCTHCQRTSGAPFSVNVIVPRDQVMVAGELAEYHDQGESGATVRRCFCPKCGSSIMSVLSSGLAAIKSGSLDDASGLTPAIQVWTRSAQGWVSSISSLRAFETMP